MKEEDIGDKISPFMHICRNFNYIFPFQNTAFSLNFHSICFKIKYYLTICYFIRKDDIQQGAEENISHVSFGI